MADSKYLSAAFFLKATDNLDYDNDWRRIHAIFASIEDHASEYNGEERRLLLTRCGDMLFSRYAAVQRQAVKTAAALLRCAGEDVVPLSRAILHPCLFPDRSLEEKQMRSLPYSIMQLISRTAAGMEKKERRLFLHNYISCFKSARWPDRTVIHLISGLLRVPASELTTLEKHEIFGFIRQFLSGDKTDIITLALCLLYHWQEQGCQPREDTQRYLDSYDIPASYNFQQKYLFTCLKTDGFKDLPDITPEVGITLFRQDRLLDRDWTSKIVNLYILQYHYEILPDNSEEKRGYADNLATHLQDVLRLNDQPMVFLTAGNLLMDLMPHLDESKNRSLFSELLKEAEQMTDGSNYLPHFLAQSFLLLPPDAHAEFAERFRLLSDSTNSDTALMIPDIICRIFNIACTENIAVGAIPALTGILARSIQDYRPEMALEADFTIRHYLLRTPAEKMDPVLRRMLVRHAYLPEADQKKLPEKVAFFQATFDPFCERDLAIVRELIDMDYHVCLSISDFSPNKNPQPAHVRRRIAMLSVADLENVSLLPEEMPVNTKNKRGIEELRSLFPGSEISLVQEYSDIDTSEKNAGNALPHIIYSDYDVQGFIDREAICHVISGRVTFLQLPAAYRGINSDEVKRKIKEHKDITGMVDIRIQSMIRKWRLYYDRPMYRKKAMTTRMTREISDDSLTIRVGEYRASLTWRNAGKTAVILSISGDVTELRDFRTLALVEFLALCEAGAVSHVVCFDAGRYGDLLTPYGFLPMQDYEDGLTLDMSEAIVLFFDIYSFLKEPFDQDLRVLTLLQKNRLELQTALTRLYPGRPVISLHSDIVNSQLIERIREKSRSVGDEGTLCVPFGKILRGILLPDITVRELNAEKQYKADLSGFEIKEIPEYSTLSAQIELLRSYDRPVMLVDDLYHKGYRFQKIQELLERGGVDIHSVVTSVISSKGIELAMKKGIGVDAVYRILNMKVWMLESDLCPFIGGDGIEDENNTHRDTYGAALSSINTILPYQMPGFLKDASPHAVYELSRVCLENTRRLYALLEDIYEEQEHQTLTFERIGQVMAEPRFPSAVLYEANKAKKISVLLEEEKRKLRRLKYM